MSTTPPARPPARLSFSRICFFGDAFAVGAGDESVLGWVSRLAENEWRRGHDTTVYNLSIRSDSTRAIQARRRREAEARLPASANGRLVFSFGGDDAKEEVGVGVSVPLEESLANACSIIAQAAAWKPVLWIGLIPMSEKKPYPRLLGGAQFRFSNERQAARPQPPYRHRLAHHDLRLIRASILIALTCPAGAVAIASPPCRRQRINRTCQHPTRLESAIGSASISAAPSPISSWSTTTARCTRPRC